MNADDSTKIKIRRNNTGHLKSLMTLRYLHGMKRTKYYPFRNNSKVKSKIVCVV